jgi:geranylgeranyl diphosphate synthase type II
MNNLKDYTQSINTFLAEQTYMGQPSELYSPIEYCISQGGKRIRAILALLGYGLFKGAHKKAFPIAAAVEIFHNFTLLHDDIMDEAPIRRGKPSIYKKYGANSAILSGDLMLIEAYRQLEQTSMVSALLPEFNKVARQVCEGQQLDMNFEKRPDVGLDEYLEMIKLKTSVLLASALKMGAILAEATDTQQENVYSFGLNLGLAFQIQDDYLDSFGEQDNFGKQVGGDIIQSKKMILYLLTLEHLNDDDQKSFLELYASNLPDKVEMVKSFFKSSGAHHKTLELKQHYEQLAKHALNRINGHPDYMNNLNEIMGFLSTRAH